MSQAEILESLKQAVIDGEVDLAKEMCSKALQTGIDPMVAIEKGLQPGLQVVGDAFGRGESFIPELIAAAQVMEASSGILNKEIEKSGRTVKSLGLLAIGTVKDDIHTIGKSIVGAIFKAAGFDIIDLGIDVPVDAFVKVVEEKQPTLLGLSSLLTTTVAQQKMVIDALKGKGLRSKVKIMIGGGAVTQDWADEIGADIYGQNAQDGLMKAKKALNLA